ncbi:MAG: ABC transporter permease [Actinomycetota bacterium]|nr:ABC transporter permease [Actinomycetota bacterium]
MSRNATTREAAPAGRPRAARLLLQQLRYEQLAFWRNPFGAGFTIGFSVVFLVLLAATGGSSRSSTLGGIRLVQYYVPGFAAYGVMSACFNTLGIQLVVRRETGLLKRLRLSPLPTWALLGGVLLNSFVVAVLQVVVLLGIGRLGYHVVLPHAWGPLLVAIVAGVVCFTALGVAISAVIPNQEAAGPIISIIYFVLLFLSGLWYPLQPGSALARVSGWFPVRRLIVAVFAPFDLRPGSSPWSWNDIGVLAAWGVVAAVFALRRFRFEPRRS